ncbi:hypothetical protein J6590_072322 [Homalodisca vitripennis]|nr:hypothetical protein J6590_072322 [Homalodisca vitripennis]
MKPRQRSPCVNDRVKAVMVLLTLVADQKYDDIDHKSQFMDAALQFCEKLFFTEESVTEVLMFMGYLYTCLAEQSRALTRVRTLIYDLLYSFTKKFHCIIFAILSTWPEVLRVKPIESYMDDPVSLAVINAFFHVTAEGNFGKNKINSFLRFLKQKYQFDATTTNIDELFDMFVTQLRWEEVHKAIILLAKKGNRGWFQKRPLGVLLDVVRQWKADKRSNEEAVCALKVIGYCVRSFNGATQQHIMQPVFELLRDILLDKNTPAWMQEVVVMTLCYIARVDWSACANLIASWKPREVSSEIFDKILVELISRRPPVWWTRTRDSRPFLNI